MSIPFYFAMEEYEAGLPAGRRCAQLGFGFREDGSPRFPDRFIPGAAAVINDNILPVKAPEPAVLDRLAEACENGCFLDFERPISEVSAAIAVGLQQRLNGKMTVPQALHSLCPDADAQIPGLLCNNWEAYVQKAHATNGDQWVLEVIPWDKRIQMPFSESKEGCLHAAVCRYRFKDGTAHYYDTDETIMQKLAVAERYGCQAGIVLLREYTKSAQFG